MDPSDPAAPAAFSPATSVEAAWPVPGEGQLASKLARCLRQEGAGSLLRAWRRLFDTKGAGRVRRPELVKGCKAAGCLYLATPIWREFSSDGGEIAFSSLFPEESADLEAFAAALDPHFGSDLAAAWEVLDAQRLNRISLQEFERGVYNLGFEGDARAIFNGIVKDNSGGRIYKEDFLYLGPLLWWTPRSPQGSCEEALNELIGHVRRHAGSEAAFMKQLALPQGASVAVDEFAARLVAVGFQQGDPTRAARCLATRQSGVCSGNVTHDASLLSLLGGESVRGTPQSPKSLRKGALLSPRSRRAALGALPWDSSMSDISHFNTGKHRVQRIYFESQPKEEDEGLATPSEHTVGGDLRRRSPSSQQSAGAPRRKQIPFFLEDDAEEDLGPEAGRAAAHAPSVRGGRVAAADRARCPRQSHQDEVEVARGLPRYRIFHFEPTRLRGGGSGSRAQVDRLIFYRNGDPITGGQLSSKLCTVSFDEPVEIDTFRFKTSNADPALDVVQWYLTGSDDGMVWHNIHSQVEDHSAKHGSIVTQSLLPDSRPDVLRVLVAEGKGLRDVEMSKHQGTSDPYCTLWVHGKPHTKVHTEVSPDRLSPKWDARLEVAGFEPGDDLRIQVRDSNFGTTMKSGVKDTNMGQARLPGSAVMEGFDGWVRLDSSGGSVRLHVRPLHKDSMAREHSLAKCGDPVEQWLGDTLPVLPGALP